MTASASNSNAVQPPSGDHRVVARVFALSDVGRTREHNEDTFLVADLESGTALDFDLGYHEITADAHGLLFLVADGMGGAASGELASSMAGDLVLAALRQHWSGTTAPSAEQFAVALRDATVAANAHIHQYAREHPQHRGMGTTATIAGLLADRLYLAQVGDSRAYLVRDGQARQITKDQSLMQRLVEAGEITPEEAEVSDRRNIILQALGPEAHITVDLTHQQLRRGDTLILCSDGLSGLVKPNEIAMLTGSDPDVRMMCRKLIDRANARGGPDNITVVAVCFDGEGLVPSTTYDTVGYTAYPLAGTLFEQTRAIPAVARPPHGTDARDATPVGGARRVTPTAIPAVDPPAPTTPTAPRATPSRAPAVLGEEVAARRRKAAQPVFIALAAAAAAAMAWTALQVLGN